jgi:type III restriction enzyme
MPTSEHGELENPKKSAFSLEYYDSRWELEHMKSLENDINIQAWTKNHGVRIPYFDENGKFRTYSPDFLIKKTDGAIELHEIKGTHLLRLPNTQKKIDSAREWCKARKIVFRLISKY